MVVVEEEEMIMMEDVEKQHQQGIREEDIRIHHVNSGGRNHHSHSHKHKKYHLNRHHKSHKSFAAQEEQNTEESESSDKDSTLSEVTSLTMSVIAADPENKIFKFIDDGSNGLPNDKRQHFGNVVSFLFAAIGSR